MQPAQIMKSKQRANHDLETKLKALDFKHEAIAKEIFKFIPEKIEGENFYHSRHKSGSCYLAGYGLHLVHAQYQRMADSLACVLIWLAENGYVKFEQTTQKNTNTSLEICMSLRGYEGRWVSFETALPTQIGFYMFAGQGVLNKTAYLFDPSQESIEGLRDRNKYAYWLMLPDFPKRPILPQQILST